MGCLHSFSAGLVIGGKDVDEEKTRISGMNILICTPGRLLQHLDETVGFDASTLQVASAMTIAADSLPLSNSLLPFLTAPPASRQVLVLDEADRILDMGFDRELRAIVQSLPDTRQTLLFSATLTKSVRALAQLSLKSPEYTAHSPPLNISPISCIKPPSSRRYCGVHDAAAASTPTRLSQHYMIVEASCACCMPRAVCRE